jgi:hypothetical protein
MLKVEKNDQIEQTKSPVYDPNKRYSWTPIDKFEMTGDQFGAILNAFRGILGSPIAEMIFRMDEVNKNVIEKILASAVVTGVVKESPEPPKTQ